MSRRSQPRPRSRLLRRAAAGGGAPLVQPRRRQSEPARRPASWMRRWSRARRTPGPSLSRLRASTRAGLAPGVTSEPTVAARAHGEPFLEDGKSSSFLLDNLEFPATSRARCAWRATGCGERGRASSSTTDGAPPPLSLVQGDQRACCCTPAASISGPCCPTSRPGVLMIEYDTTPADGGAKCLGGGHELRESRERLHGAPHEAGQRGRHRQGGEESRRSCTPSLA